MKTRKETKEKQESLCKAGLELMFLRRKKGLTQKELCALIGQKTKETLSVTHLSRIERGAQAVPKVKTLNALAKILGKDVLRMFS
jgi:transcriptional regulator with XRE-family HTH domain